MRMITEDPEDQLRPADRQEALDPHGTGRQGAPGSAEGRGRQDARRRACLEKWDHLTEADSRGGGAVPDVCRQVLRRSGRRGVEDAREVRLRSPARLGLRAERSSGGVGDAGGGRPRRCRRLYGSLDVKWGDVYRLASGDADMPGNGGAGDSGLFRTIAYTRKVGNRYYAANGETIVCAIEFGKTQQARCTLGYGNSSQTGSPHLSDQIPLMVAEDAAPGVARPQGDRGEPGEARRVLSAAAKRKGHRSGERCPCSCACCAQTGFLICPRIVPGALNRSCWRSATETAFYTRTAIGRPGDTLPRGRGGRA